MGRRSATRIARTNQETIERALERMRARYKEMSESQQRLADYILEKPYQIAFASAAKVGAELRMSSATVVRFAEFLGLDGYTDLQDLARNSLHREVSEVVEFKRTSRSLTGESIFHKNLRADIECIERTGGMISEEVFDKAVDLTAKARNLFLVGLRSNYGLAQHLAFNLSVIGRQAVLITPNVGDLPEQLLQMQPGDVCIAISVKRYTALTRDILEYAREKDVQVIAITDSERSPIGELADVRLPFAVRFPSFLASRVAALSVMNALMVGVALLRRKATTRALGQHEAMWARYSVYMQEAARNPVDSHIGAIEALESANGVDAGAHARKSRRRQS